MRHLTFKDWLLSEAKKKPKEPEWFDADSSSGYGQLRDIQTRFDWRRKPIPLQLFVPKHRDPDLMYRRAAERRYVLTKRELEAEKIKEDTTPVLTSFSESPPGSNKPSSGFWTSSAMKVGDAYTSDWYNFVKHAFPEWQTDYGFLFEVDQSALVFDLEYADMYYEWAYAQGKLTLPKSEWDSEFSSSDMRRRFPWDSLARHFDGAHHSRTHDTESFTFGWDVESTVWFNTRVLRYKGAVKLVNSRYTDEDDY